jgi:hypothetical protein
MMSNIAVKNILGIKRLEGREVDVSAVKTYINLNDNQWSRLDGRRIIDCNSSGYICSH